MIAMICDNCGKVEPLLRNGANGEPDPPEDYLSSRKGGWHDVCGEECAKALDSKQGVERGMAKEAILWRRK